MPLYEVDCTLLIEADSCEEAKQVAENIIEDVWAEGHVQEHCPAIILQEGKQP